MTLLGMILAVLYFGLQPLIGLGMVFFKPDRALYGSAYEQESDYRRRQGTGLLLLGNTVGMAIVFLWLSLP